jgi:hypothetical protein
MGREDVSSKKRAGRRVRRQLRAEAWAATRRNGRLLLTFLGVYPQVVGMRLGGLALSAPHVRDEQAAADDRHVLDIEDDRVASVRSFFGDQAVPDEPWS